MKQDNGEPQDVDQEVRSSLCNTEMRLTSERSSTMSNTLICYGIFRCILDSSNVNFEKIVFFRIALLLSEKLNDRSDP